MLRSLAFLFSFGVLATTSFGQSLHDFMVAQKWDAAKSGALIGLQTSEVYHSSNDPNEPPPSDFAAYGRMVVTLGHVNAVVPQMRIDFPPDDAPNPYDAIPLNDRMAAFLGSLNPDQWRRLSETGLAPKDCSGLQRLLLLSLIPHPLSVQEYVYENGGYGTDKDPIPVLPGVADEVRFQMYKGLDIGFRAMVDPESHTGMWNGISSLGFHPAGAHVYRVATTNDKPGFGGYSGRIIENTEKPSQLNSKDAKLSKKIELQTGITLKDEFKQIRDECGVEIYPDVRLETYKLDIIGDSATAADVLRAMALCVAGTYRKVGPAYVLTANLEGQLTRSSRTRATAALVQLDLQSRVIEARQRVKSGHLLDRLDFLPNDAFKGKAFLQSLNIPLSVDADPGWFADSVATTPIKNAIPAPPPPNPQPDPTRPNEPKYIPDPKLLNKIHLKVSVGFRYILPDGTIVEAQNLNLDEGMSYGYPKTDPVPLPLDTSKTTGLSAGFRSDDPGDVKTFCTLASQHGLKEIWLETQNKEALQAAVDSSLKVNLLLRPWQILKGEDWQPDVNPLGQTAGQLNEILAARYNGQRNDSWWFVNSMVPQQTVPDDHIQRLVSLASTKGVNRVILIDSVPSGYTQFDSNVYSNIDNRPIFGNGTELGKSLKQISPSVYEFGYAPAKRLDYLRKYGIDIVDLENPHQHTYIAEPYFQEGPFGNYAYPRVYFSEGQIYGIMQKIMDERSKTAQAGLQQMVDALTAAKANVWVQYVLPNLELSRPFYEFKPSANVADSYIDDAHVISMLSVNPLTAEDANGSIQYGFAYGMNRPFCFNFSEVPVKRLPLYFDAIFKAPASKN